MSHCILYLLRVVCNYVFFFFQAEDGIRDYKVTGVQTCALPIYIDVIIARCSMLDARCSMLDARCSMLDARCSMLDARCSMLDARCSMLDARCSMLDARCSTNKKDRKITRLNSSLLVI